MSDVKKYYDSKGNVMAILIPSDYHVDGINFLSNDNDFQQIAVMEHKENHIILPHYHNKISRTVDYTCETLVIRNGVLNVVLYENQKPIHDFDIKTGDIITLLSGGHGFKVVKDVDMVEVKQGPFMGPEDKTRF